jgi:hypothetical protein
LKVPAAVTLWAVYYLGPWKAFRRFCFWKGGKMEKNMSAFYKGEDAEKTATSATKDKEASIFKNHRFWEYVAQIKIDGHDPADILEPWMKKHHPEYFEDSDDVAE